jgi:hypothetical protein
MQRVTAVRRIKHDEREVCIIQKQCVRQTIIRLPRQIPQNRFTLRPILAPRAEFVDHPELLPVRRRMFLILAMRQTPPQPRLPHPRITHQHDLRRRMMHCLRRECNPPDRLLTISTLAPCTLQ